VLDELVPDELAAPGVVAPVWCRGLVPDERGLVPRDVADVVPADVVPADVVPDERERRCVLRPLPSRFDQFDGAGQDRPRGDPVEKLTG